MELRLNNTKEIVKKCERRRNEQFFRSFPIYYYCISQGPSTKLRGISCGKGSLPEDFAIESYEARLAQSASTEGIEAGPSTSIAD